MPNNVYVGSRYVPIFDGAWDNTKSYEPLTIVEYGNNSYTSKKSVPAGTLPTDTSYWALTGNYNGQISNLQTQITANADNIAKLLPLTPQAFDGKKILILGDSISDENVHPNNWVTSFRAMFPNAVIINNSLNGRWLSQIPALLSSYTFNNYDYVIIFAGINDWINNEALGSWGTGTAFTDSLRSIGAELQNKTCHTFLITSLCTTRTANCPLNLFRAVMVQAAKYWGLNWINGGAFPHIGGSHSTAFMSDGLHPDSSYSDIMAEYIAGKLLCGGDSDDCDNGPYDMDIPAAAILSAVSSVTKKKMYFKDGTLHLLLSGTLTFSNTFYTEVLTSPFDSILSKVNSNMNFGRYTCVVTQNNAVIPTTAWLYNNNIIVQHGTQSGTGDLFLDVELTLKQVYI